MAAMEPRRRSWYWGLAAIGLGSLLMTKSRMSLCSLLVAGAAVYMMRWPSRFKAAIFLGVGTLLCGLLLALQLSDFDLSKEVQHYTSLGREEDMESFTGRLPLWMELTHSIEDRPLLGYGYRAFWDRQHTLEVGEALGGWQVPHAHDGYLDTTLDFGLPMAAAFALLAFLAMGRTGRLYRSTGEPGYAFAYALLVYALFDSLLESNFVIPNLMPFVTVCAAFQVSLRVEMPEVVSLPVMTLEPAR
jgi:O-antigen ligase